MFTSVKQKALTVKDHVIRHRGVYGVATGFAAGIAINQHAVKEWNAFLTEKGLLDEFYAPE